MSKKMYCLLLAFVMLLAVSAVSAAENIDDASLAADDSTDTIAVDEIVDDVEADSADDSDKLAADEKLDPKLNVTTKVSDYGDIGINVTTEKNATGKVTINVTNSTGDLVVNATEKLVNGSYYLGDLGFTLPKGGYIVSVFYEGDANYTNATKLTSFLVEKSVPTLNVIASVNKYGILEVIAVLNTNATGNVSFNMVRSGITPDPKNATNETIKDGNATFDELYYLENGDYEVYVDYYGDDNYYATYMYHVPVTSDKHFLKPTTTNINVTGGEVNITVDLGFTDAQGNVSVVYPSGYVDNVTIKNGIVEIYNVFMTEQGNISLVLNYDGDAKYYGFYEYYIDFYVKASSFISAAPVSVVYQNNGKVTVTLTDNNDNGTGKNPIAGANVTVTLNGKQYVGVTDAKGIATITIPANLVPKAYTATVSYAGNATCNGDENTFIFTVTKATPKITAKKKTFKAKKKTKKYAVTLKAGKNPVKGVKVTLKIKGKKAFSAKTNAKGKATFKITKLTKKGKYKAVIKSKANSYYKAAAKKKVKITVK